MKKLKKKLENKYLNALLKDYTKFRVKENHTY